jgi:HK97 family phage portal protein
MRQFLANTLKRLAGWLQPRGVPAPLRLGNFPGRTFIDAYRHHREPTPLELLGQLKNTAWTCASINAAVCASFPPRLYVTTQRAQPAPRCLTRAVAPHLHNQLRRRTELAARLKSVDHIEEVVEHPLLTLLQQVNPAHNGFDLWELTQVYLEVHGCAYWYLDLDPMLHIPQGIWILPAHQVSPRRMPDSANLVDYYEYRSGGAIQHLKPDAIIHFRFPDPREPYTSGLSPLRACFEQAALTSEYAAMKRAIYDNTGLPSAIVSPDQILTADERDRLEKQWDEKFRRGGSGKVLVSESGLKVDILAHSMGDLAALADLKATKEDIANAFHVPLPFLTGDTNLANMQAADHLHKSLAILPRLRRRDQKLNEQLLPLYDSSGRLFLLSDDPTPTLQEFQIRLQESDLKYGVRTVNELRSERGLPPVPWGDEPFAAGGSGSGGVGE